MSFNTQPPEGGWIRILTSLLHGRGFNTQPPEGGWYQRGLSLIRPSVSTHSRPKAAGYNGNGKNRLVLFQHTAARRRLVYLMYSFQYKNCFNTQPPEGGWLLIGFAVYTINGFNTQPPEGGWDWQAKQNRITERFNTQPPEGGWLCSPFFAP